MSDIPLPEESQILETLHMLYSDEATASPTENSEDWKYAATFIDDDDDLTAVIACDIQLAAFAGSALTRIPPGGAEDCVGEGAITEAMQGNLYEFMNIASRWLMDNDSPHLRLAELKKIDEFDDDVAELVENGRSLNFQIGIPNYGEGSLICSAK